MKSTLLSRTMIPLKVLCATLPLALGLISITAIEPAMAQEQVLRTVTVSGRGVESTPATIAQVSLGVEAQGETAEEVQRKVAEQSAAVVEFLRSRNVDKLQTTGVYLSPTYDYSGDRQRIVGYTASNTVRFEISTAQAGNLLDEAVAVGATRIDGINFIATDEAIAEARQTAIQEAAQDARTQATAVLESLGFTPDEIVSIQVNGASPPPPIFVQDARYNMSAPMAEAAATPIVGGDQQVEAYVTLQISY